MENKQKTQKLCPATSWPTRCSSSLVDYLNDRLRVQLHFFFI